MATRSGGDDEEKIWPRGVGVMMKKKYGQEKWGAMMKKNVATRSGGDDEDEIWPREVG